MANKKFSELQEATTVSNDAFFPFIDNNPKESFKINRANLALQLGNLVPAGGTTDQNLAKNSDTDYDFKRVDAPVPAGIYEAIVDDSGTGDYTTIDAAIAAGKTILAIKSGSYTLTHGTILNDKGIVLHGYGDVSISVTKTVGVDGLFLMRVTTENVSNLVFPIEFKNLQITVSASDAADFYVARLDNIGGGTFSTTSQYPTYLFKMESCNFYMSASAGTSFWMGPYIYTSNIACIGTCNGSKFFATDVGGGQNILLSTFYSSLDYCGVTYNGCTFRCQTSTTAGTHSAQVQAYANCNKCSFYARGGNALGTTTTKIRTSAEGTLTSCILRTYYGRFRGEGPIINSIIELYGTSIFGNNNLPFASGYSDWAAGQSYLLNQFYLYDYRIWRCLKSFTSDANPFTDRALGNVEIYEPAMELNTVMGNYSGCKFSLDNGLNPIIIWGADTANGSQYRYQPIYSVNGCNFNGGRAIQILGSSARVTNNRFEITNSQSSIPAQVLINNSYSTFANNQIHSHYAVSSGSETARLAPRGNYNSVTGNTWLDDNVIPSYTEIGSPTGNVNANNIFYNW